MYKPLMLFEFVVTQMTMHHSFYIYASKRHQKLINILWTNLYLLIVKADNGYLKKDFIYVFVNTHTHIYTCAHMCRCLWRPEGGHQIPRSWSWQAFVIHLVWVLGSDSCLHGWATSTLELFLHPWAMSVYPFRWHACFTDVKGQVIC